MYDMTIGMALDDVSGAACISPGLQQAKRSGLPKRYNECEFSVAFHSAGRTADMLP